MKRDNELILGLGEVGNSLKEVIKAEGYDTAFSDPPSRDSYEVLHVCFPCVHRESFVISVTDYAIAYGASYVVIHSTVPVGTCQEIENALKPFNAAVVHSPVRGLHPNLASSIKTFVKYYGGPAAEEVAARYAEVIPHFCTTPKAASTEALKLWSTTAYGWSIILEKSIYAYCEKHGLDFDIVYTHATNTYNEGYEKMGMQYFRRPVLRHMRGGIGGHCVIPNAKLLKDECLIADWLLAMNRNFEEKE